MTSFWEKHEVPISLIQRCHVLDYEHQLVPILLSHCQYSLTFGKGQNVRYDHKAMQKHILDRFIHGKPLIVGDAVQIQYQKDIYTTHIFSAVRRKVNPQVRIIKKHL